MGKCVLGGFLFYSCWGNATLTLNSNVGAVVGFREFANNSLGLWGDSGIYAITTTNDTSVSTATPAPSVAPTSNPTPTSTSTLNPTTNPTPTPSINQTGDFPTQTAILVLAVIVVFVGVLVIAFKKGYITIEVVDEETTEEQK